MCNTEWKRWLGYRIRDIHVVVAYLTASSTLVLPLSFVKWAFVWWIGVLFVNVLYGKCIFTKIEIELTGENYTIIDEYLMKLGKDINNKNRSEFTIFSGVFMLLVCVIRLYFGI